MSRVGLSPVTVPDGVTLSIAGQLVTAKGKLGELSVNVVDDVEVSQEDNLVRVKARNDSQQARAMWGTTRSLVQNIVTGVAEGFTINLEIVGVGYRAAVQGKFLVLQLGFSHEVRHPIPEGITIKCESPTAVSVSGADRQLVGQVAANIRKYRKPEPYKGKGVRYENEFILRKEGKKK
ncbi:MAG: 50S ribosomal protein L6 [Alphaproteobacteria bacterium]|nr:50S ribosomal protein L6 [Alphaproteobacteria bacterium]